MDAPLSREGRDSAGQGAEWQEPLWERGRKREALRWHSGPKQDKQVAPKQEEPPSLSSEADVIFSDILMN